LTDHQTWFSSEKKTSTLWLCLYFCQQTNRKN